MPRSKYQSQQSYDLQQLIDCGSFSQPGYGTGNKEDADLNKTESGYVLVTATDGTWLEKPMKEVGGMWATISGSTNSSGLLGATHSLGFVPSVVTATYHGTNAFFVTATNIGANTIDFKFFTGSAAVSTTAVTMSYMVKV